MGGEQVARLQGKTSFPLPSPHTSLLKTKMEMQSETLGVPFLLQYEVLSARKVQLQSWEQEQGKYLGNRPQEIPAKDSGSFLPNCFCLDQCI